VLARQSPGHLERALTPLTPPLVLALLAAGPETWHLVPEEEWLDARVYLSPEDLAELAGSAAERPRVKVAPALSPPGPRHSDPAAAELLELLAEAEARRRNLP